MFQSPEFWQSFRTNFWRSYPTFFLAVLLPVISLWSSFFYAGQAVGNWILFLPCVFSVYIKIHLVILCADFTTFVWLHSFKRQFLPF